MVVVACDDGSVQTGECGVARVRCVLTECAEPLLLQAWLRHHAHLFGLENLTVFDSSTDAATAKLLLGAQRAGVDVRRGQGSETGCEQAKIVMKSWRADEAAIDFAIPLTCEEFLAVYTADGVSCRRDRVHAALDLARGQTLALEPSPALASVDGARNEFTVAPVRFCVLPADMLDRLDCVSTMSKRFETPVTCLRFGADPADESGMRVVFQGLGNLLDAFGIHSERLGSPVLAPRGAPDDAVWVRAVEGARPVRFKAGAYCRANEDVASSRWLPFLHYVARGASEGRRLE